MLWAGKNTDAAILATLLAASLLSTPGCSPEPHPNRIIDRIEVGGKVSALTVSPDGKRLFVSWHWAAKDGDISVLSTADHRLVDSVACEQQVFGMLLTPDGRSLYVGDVDDPHCLGRVWMVNDRDTAIVFRDPDFSTPLPLAATPDGKLMYIGSITGYKLRVIRVKDHTVTDTVVVNGGVRYAALPGDGKRLYVGGNGIAVVRTSDNRVCGSGLPGRFVHGLAASNDPERLYVSAWTPDDTFYLYSLRLPDLTVEDSVPTRYLLEDIVATPDGRYVYGICKASKAVFAFSPKNRTITDSIPLEFEPTHLKALPDGSRLYVTGYQQNQVTVIGH